MQNMTIVDHGGTLVCRINVDYTRSLEIALNATGRTVECYSKIVDRMFKGLSGEVEIVFFKPNLFRKKILISNEELEYEFGLYNLNPADPISVAALNEVNPIFADEHSNGTHWKDDKGHWCSAAFDRWGDNRRVHIDHKRDYWDEIWWFAGIRK